MVLAAPSVYPAQSGPPQTATFPPVMFSPQPVYVPQQFTMPMPVSLRYSNEATILH